MWYIEYHRHKHLDAPPVGTYKSHFWTDFVQLNTYNLRDSSGMTWNPKTSVCDICSFPRQWPMLESPHRATPWDEEHARVYMMGNPYVWWFVFPAVVVHAVLLVVYTLRHQRRYEDFDVGGWERFRQQSTLLLGAYAIHYLPFFMVGRFTLIHHYAPALYFSMLSAAYVVDHAMTRLHVPLLLQRLVYMGIIAVMAQGFLEFLPASYGMSGPLHDFTHLMWRPLWNIGHINPIAT
jgi:dolichyl-phosphate-mannose-protein mannosyltransferase